MMKIKYEILQRAAISFGYPSTIILNQNHVPLYIMYIYRRILHFSIHKMAFHWFAHIFWFGRSRSYFLFVIIALLPENSNPFPFKDRDSSESYQQSSINISNLERSS